ncbi:MAG: hypothetical protein JNG90_07410 [Planctomycetaceae bacterium]|nr:hypothetical protein [Planctomycetaceae bacterium]
MTREQIAPFLSGYLMGGWREDELRLMEVDVARDRITGIVDAVRHYAPSDGQFHLTVPQAFLWISQLGIIHGCWDHELERKPGEIYLREIGLQCRAPVRQTCGIEVTIHITGRRRVPQGCFYQGTVAIGGAAFVGEAKYVLPLG